MVKKILIGLLFLIVLFLGYVSTRPSQFRYERSGVINAPAEQVFNLISNFRMGEKWSPYERIDPTMKKTFSGTDGEVGSVLEFEGNRDVGSGKLELLKKVPNELIEIKLTMIKPFFGENLIEYKLTPETEGTRFTWSMSGDGGFMGKLMATIIDCEKMVGDQMNQGISNLKTHLEAK